MGCGSKLGDWFTDPFSWKNMSDIVGAGVDPLGNALGMQGPGMLASGQFWELPSAVKSDWTRIKHLLVADMRRDREMMSNSATTARRIIYGKCRVSGQIAYVESAGDKNQFLHLIVILSGHPVAGFGEVYLDDKLIGEFGSKAYYELFTGNQITACQSLIGASAGRWTAAHKLLGCAYIYLKLEYDETLFSSGLPIVRVVVQGKNDLYDPRYGTFGWSDNPAICAYDYMVLPEALGGMGCTEDDSTTAARLAWYESNCPVYADLYRRIWGMA